MGIMKKVDIYPDYGHSWGLWSDIPPFPPEDGSQLSPHSFDLSHKVEKALKNWLQEWRDNFADADESHADTWKPSFDIDRWIEEGNRIADMVAIELPEYTISRGFLLYGKKPYRS